MSEVKEFLDTYIDVLGKMTDAYEPITDQLKKGEGDTVFNKIVELLDQLVSFKSALEDLSSSVEESVFKQIKALKETVSETSKLITAVKDCSEAVKEFKDADGEEKKKQLTTFLDGQLKALLDQKELATTLLDKLSKASTGGSMFDGNCCTVL